MFSVYYWHYLFWHFTKHKCVILSLIPLDLDLKFIYSRKQCPQYEVEVPRHLATKQEAFPP